MSERKAAADGFTISDILRGYASVSADWIARSQAISCAEI